MHEPQRALPKGAEPDGRRRQRAQASIKIDACGQSRSIAATQADPKGFACCQSRGIAATPRKA
jgi:hypothetical protein